MTSLSLHEGQGSLACCSPWGHKELDMPERLNNKYSMAWMYCSWFNYSPIIGHFWASLVAQMVKSACSTGDLVQSLGWEDSLEKEMETHSSTLALKIPWTEELGAGYYPWGRKESGTTE